VSPPATRRSPGPGNWDSWTAEATSSPGTNEAWPPGRLHDIGVASTPEPFGRLFNQGYILADAFTDARGQYVPAAEVTRDDGKWTYRGQRLGHPKSLTYEPFPQADPALAAQATVTLPVQVGGKRRFAIEVPASAGEAEIAGVLACHPDFPADDVARLVIVPGKIVSIVLR
jgi:leucyl-tRNA synthetase